MELYCFVKIFKFLLDGGENTLLSSIFYFLENKTMLFLYSPPKQKKPK